MLIYLASPYSKFPGGRESANNIVSAKAASLMLKGYPIFCPIAHSHAIELWMDDTKDGDFWLKQDFAVLENCTEMWVYKMPGWDQSDGVRREIEFAKQHHIPIEYLDFDMTE
jgi:hypothetical protein